MGRVALVSGASRGIGRGIAKALAQAGYTVAANYRSDDEAAASLAVEHNAKGVVSVEHLPFSVAGTDAMLALLSRANSLAAATPPTMPPAAAAAHARTQHAQCMCLCLTRAAGC